MDVYLNEINGIADAICSLYMTKRSWAPELYSKVRNACDTVLDRYGSIKEEARENDPETYDFFINEIYKVLKWGKVHTTIIRFIDLSFTVNGLHRAGQDDWDAHAMRFQNRIIRASTRVGDEWLGTPKSNFYEDKIITTEEAITMNTSAKEREILIPDEFVDVVGNTWVKKPNGYVKKEYANDKDVVRGLYMESIPSMFIFRCDLADFCHVYKLRNKKSGANPEVKELAENIAILLGSALPMITPEYLLSVEI